MNADVNIELSPALIVKPGDTLLIGFARRLDMAEADYIRRRIEARLPDIAVIVLPEVEHLAVQPAAEH